MMDFRNFTTIKFAPPNPDASGFVYVWFYVDESGREVPFYVGQTKRIWGRMDDYYWAMFSASTDFKVGEAIRYLSEMKRPVVLKYQQTNSPQENEKVIIQELKQQYQLLNFLPGFNSKNADPALEQSKVQDFVKRILVRTGSKKE